MSKRWLWLGWSWAAFSVSAESRPFDELFYDATRYANMPERMEAKQHAKEALSARMPEALHAAFEYADGDNVMLQVLLMEWVQGHEADVIVPALLAHLDDGNEHARRLALFFLGFHDAPEHADKIFPQLENEKTRGAALRTLGKWKISAARPAAERWLIEGKERQRVVAANALRDIGDPAAMPALVKALADPVFTVRHAAARAMLVLAKDDPSLIPESAEAQRLLDRIRADAGLRVADDGLNADGSFFSP